jgi:cytidine deaminase
MARRFPTRTRSARFPHPEYAAGVQPTPDDLDLYEQARAAAAHAHAPYSRFAVGAALRTAGGTVVTGVNVENSSYGLSCCAERTAMFAAVTGGHRQFTAIAVHADAESAPPCGACRQVLSEFAPELRVIWRRQGALAVTSLSQLLPDSFRL